MHRPFLILIAAGSSELHCNYGSIDEVHDGVVKGESILSEFSLLMENGSSTGRKSRILSFWKAKSLINQTFAGTILFLKHMSNGLKPRTAQGGVTTIRTELRPTTPSNFQSSPTTKLGCPASSPETCGDSLTKRVLGPADHDR